MLRTIPYTRDARLAVRLTGIAVFTLLTIVGARVSVEIGAVPFTLQTLAVLLAGLVLGARDGALSQLAYVALVTAGLPLDARGLGTAVYAGPTWGFMVAFIPAAFVTGWLAEQGAARTWQRIAAGVVGALLILALGTLVLRFATGIAWDEALTAGFVRFIPVELAKAMIAAAAAEGGRALLMRQSGIQ